MLVIGNLFGFFNSSRGLRDGDLLSTLVIVMEPLIRMISVLVRKIYVLVNSGFVAGFLVGDINRSTLNISHLFLQIITIFLCRTTKPDPCTKGTLTMF